MTVLVAEDEPELRHLIAQHLQDTGYRVLSAADGSEALDLLNRENAVPQLAVLDLMMPNLCGWDVLKEIRRTHPDMAVLIISGYAESGIHDQLDELGYEGMLTKPFELSQLGAEVARLLAEPRDLPQTP